MSRVEVVDKSATTSTNLDSKIASITIKINDETNKKQLPPIIYTQQKSEINCDPECSQTNKTKHTKVVFDLEKKNDDSNTNNNDTNIIRRLSNVSTASSKRSNKNNNTRKTAQVELNMDSVVVAKSAANSNNNPINNRIRNIIEIFRNTFNTNAPTNSRQKQKNKRQAIHQPAHKQTSETFNSKSKQTVNNKCSNDDTSTCQLCFNICSVRNKEDGSNYMYNLDTCEHSFCIDCLRLYLKYQIIESRVSISCPQCNEKMHPNDIYSLLSLTNLITSIDAIPISITSCYINTITGISSPPLSTSSSASSSSETPSRKLLPTTSTTPEPIIKSNSQKSVEPQSKSTTPLQAKKPIMNLQEQQQNWPTLIQKYEEFMLRRVLVTIADTRWCPAPDCTYAVIASGCANCPQLYCMRPDCNTSFCYHCKQYWHPNLTCEDAALRNNQSPIGILINIDSNNQNATSTNKLIRSFLQRSNSHISTGSSNAGGVNLTTNGATSNSTANAARIGSDLIKEEIKRCPKCQALIVKMDDGSCNHITCAVCGCEFCWLCMKEISDLHYLSPSGCTFWGKKPWSRKKKILWQLGILIGAPVGIALIAGVAVPAILIGLPIWSGRKVYVRYKTFGKHKRNLIVMGTVVGTVLVAPLVAALAVGIGVPILLAYVYGVVPISLCRSGGCGVTTNNNGGVRFAFDDETTDNTNFFGYNNESTNQESAINSNNTNKRTSSVKIPISAIESKPDNILTVRSSPKSNDPNNVSSRPHTPVLVTITVANKSNIKQSNPLSTSNKLKQNNRIKRNKSASSSSTAAKDTKKSKLKPTLSSKDMTSIATSCGSVELLKLNKTSDDFSDFNKTKDVKCKSIAAELVNATGPMSSLTTQKIKLNSTSNTSDFETNLSSSSSHHLITNKQDVKENVNKSKSSKQSKTKMNPSIGEMSIGAFTNTSLSGDIIDADDDGEEYEEDDNNNSTNKKNDFEYDDNVSNFQYDQENSSTKAMASGSIKKIFVESKNFNKNEHNKKLNKVDSKLSYDKPIDTYSVSIISEKSINHSVTALAGSMK